MAHYENRSDRGLNAALAAVLRAERGASKAMTNKWLADKTGLTVASVQRYLAGDRHMDVNHLAAFADALGMTPAELADKARERLVLADVVEANVSALGAKKARKVGVQQKTAARKNDKRES